MFRGLSTRRGYEKLLDEYEASSTPEPKLSRAKTLPARILSGSKKMIMINTNTNTNTNTATTVQVKKASKVHPFFSIFETRRKKKATAKPEFSRYLEYVKEGGLNMSVLH